MPPETEDVDMAVPEISGFGHVDLTVTDVERSVQWWQDVMGFQLVAQDDDRPGLRVRSLFHPSFTAIGLVAHEAGATAKFDERVVGLDHLALRVPDRATLEEWMHHLEAHGVAHSGIQDEVGGPLIVFRDPDNIQLELWALDMHLARSLTMSTS